jgi:hypothetical protein
MRSYFRNLLRAWRARGDPSRLLLWEVLRRRGTRKLANGNEDALRFAVERCTSCRDAQECDRLLAAHWDSGIESFCPNTMFVRHLDAMKRHAR